MNDYDYIGIKYMGGKYKISGIYRTINQCRLFGYGQDLQDKIVFFVQSDFYPTRHLWVISHKKFAVNRIDYDFNYREGKNHPDKTFKDIPSYNNWACSDIVGNFLEKSMEALKTFDKKVNELSEAEKILFMMMVNDD